MVAGHHCTRQKEKEVAEDDFEEEWPLRKGFLLSVVDYSKQVA